MQMYSMTPFGHWNSTDHSVAILNERNLSLTNICQDTEIEIMDVLEEQLCQLSFHGTNFFYIKQSPHP